MVKKPTYEELEKRIRKLEQSKSEAERVKDSLAEKSMYLYNILRSAGDVAIATTDLDFRITYYKPNGRETFWLYSSRSRRQNSHGNAHERKSRPRLI